MKKMTKPETCNPNRRVMYLTRDSSLDTPNTYDKNSQQTPFVEDPNGDTWAIWTEQAGFVPVQVRITRDDFDACIWGDDLDAQLAEFPFDADDESPNVASPTIPQWPNVDESLKNLERILEVVKNLKCQILFVDAE